jgi:predicted GNAT superfamily acetyltransferase
MALNIRPPQNAQEVRQLETLQQEIWRMSDREIMPYNVIHAWMHAGGIVLCALEGEKMVGFCASFLGTLGSKRVQWSHMTGVLPDHQRQKIGYQLKLAQREKALEQGIETIAWTFDPLRHLNAIFNLHVLGAVAVNLHPEMYGQMTDGLNRGLLSDRFETHWNLRSDRVQKRIGGEKPAPASLPADLPYLLRPKGQEPQIEKVGDAAEIGIELPADVEALRSANLAQRWYLALRETLIPRLKVGYRVEGVSVAAAPTFTYRLCRAEHWYLYVLETADHTLYTGITNALDRRLVAHNAGKGAKYTSSRRPVKLMAVWQAKDRGHATALETALKRLSRPSKLRLITDNKDFRDAPRLR